MKIKEMIKFNQNLAVKLRLLINIKKQIKLLDLNKLLNQIVNFLKILQMNLILLFLFQNKKTKFNQRDAEEKNVAQFVIS